MSGHSKWATTKHKKALVDAKRSASFTKLANVVTIAARNGGDPTMNFQLRLAIDRAKAASMPKDNIDRALRRAQGKLGDDLSEVIYEGYGPGGVAILVRCLTDNRLRTVSNVRSYFNKFAGSLGEAGSVAYLFEKKGQIIINLADNSSLSSSDGEARSGDPLIVPACRQAGIPAGVYPVGGNDDTRMEEAILNSGADDFENDDGIYIVYTSLINLQSVSKYLEDAGAKIDSQEIVYLPKTKVGVPEDKHASLEKLIEALEADDDVADVYTNI